MPRSAVKLTPSAKGRLWDLQNRALDLEAKLTSLTNATAKSKNNSNTNSNRQATGTGEAVDRLRVPLCEIMAELLLADAEFSWHYDVVHRLWKNCFYSRIGTQRMEVGKAKRRVGKLLQQQQQPNNSSNNNNAAQLANALEASLNQFLAESIALYEFLTDKLEKKLLPPGYSQSQADASYTQTQSTQATTTNGGDDDENLDAIVPVLNLLYIHLGDLYRYANQLPLAQDRYEFAARLGPGQGHAYNQIAVTCQLKEQQGSSPLSAVALYWYCRSLLPDVAPFCNATSNLHRLFLSNRDWLPQQQTHNSNSDTSVVVTHATKAAAVRAFLAQFADLAFDFYQGIAPTTTTTSRHHLLQHPAAAAAATPAMMYSKVAKLTESLEGLLKLSAFGDALVCKMITILAFSECHVPTLAAAAVAAANDDHTSNNSESENNDNNNTNMANGMMQATALVARTTTYQMATLLADRVLAGLRKIKAASSGAGKNNNNATNSMSVRLLLPLLLVAEFTAHREATFLSTGAGNQSNNNTNSNWMVTTSDYEIRHKQAMQAFWKKMVDVWNLLHPLAIATNVDETKVDGLQEYEALRGFAPFTPFLTKRPCSSSSSGSATMPPPPARTTNDLPPGFLTAQESIPVVLDKNYEAIVKATKSSDAAAAARNSNNNNNSTQETNSTKGSTSNFQLEQGRIKIARMLHLAKSLADDLQSELGLCICRMSTGEYAWIENKEHEAMAVVQNDGDDDHVHAMVDVGHNDDNNNDSSRQHQQRQFDANSSYNNRNAVATSSGAPLVYQQASGGGPALLVPGLLLQNQGLPATTAAGQPNIAVGGAPAVAIYDNAGFDSSRMMTREHPQQQGVNHGVDLHSMLLGGPPGIMGDTQAPALVNPPPGFSVPPPPASLSGFDLQNLNMGMMPLGLSAAIPPSQPMQPMSDSLHALGGVSLATANPFATTTRNDNNSMHATAMNGSIIPPLREENVSFLGGGDDDEMAGVDLLGSGLLYSLWGTGEDASGSYSTNNPFAAS